MKPITLKALARELNLSVSAVSRALNNRHDIAQDTKRRVQEMAARLNYKPNAYASSLRSHRSKTIGIVLPKVDNHFFSLAIDGIEEVARENDYHVLISLTHEEPRQEAEIIKLLASGRVDGILLSSTGPDFAHLQLLRERGIPVVFFDRVYGQLPVAQVTTDDYESGYKATRHLLAAGCRTLVHLGISAHLSISQRRLQGYAAALRDQGRPYEPGLVLQNLTDTPASTDLIERLLTQRPDIDGIFASVEGLAMNSYEACHRLGRSG
jgi:LacI family transcriptional regulator